MWSLHVLFAQGNPRKVFLFTVSTGETEPEGTIKRLLKNVNKQIKKWDHRQDFTEHFSVTLWQNVETSTHGLIVAGLVGSLFEEKVMKRTLVGEPIVQTAIVEGTLVERSADEKR